MFRSTITRVARTTCARAAPSVANARTCVPTMAMRASSSVTMTQSNFSNLASLLEREIKEEKEMNAEESHDMAEMEEFLSKFTVVETPGNSMVKMTTRHETEKIEVLFHADFPAPEDDPEFDSEEDSIQLEDGSQEVDESIMNLPFTVNITKKGTVMNVNCHASNEGFYISSVSMDAEAEEDGGAFEARIDEFPHDVQEAFYAYMAERGIDDSFASFVTKFADNKERADYLTFMEKFERFIR